MFTRVLAYDKSVGNKTEVANPTPAEPIHIITGRVGQIRRSMTTRVNKEKLNRTIVPGATFFEIGMAISRPRDRLA